MNFLKLLVLVLILVPVLVLAQNYEIDWYVIGSGGGESQSSNYQTNGTIGQPIIGMSSSPSYTVEAGFWVGAGGPGGYEYLPGDVNMANGAWPPLVIGGDVTYLVNYFRGMETSPPCPLGGFWGSADINGDCLVIGSDVTRLVTYFRGLVDLSYCIDYEPAWHDASELPPSAPPGWPNCEGDGIASKNNITSNKTD